MSSSDESSQHSYDKIRYKHQVTDTNSDSDTDTHYGFNDDNVDKWSKYSSSDLSSESNDIDSIDHKDNDGILDDSNSLDYDQWIKSNLKTDIPDFEGKFGLSENVNLPSSPSPIDIFTLFLTPTIVNYIVQQSNLYRTQQNLKQEPMTDSDFYQLLGFLFYASLIKLPSKGDYWSPLSLQETVANNISRNRIDELLRTLHFNNNVINETKCDKVQPLIDFFNERCTALVDQEEYISIDEQMVSYKGKTAPSSLKQYMPNKPSKHGFKLWSKCGVSGYVYKINLYTGANKAVSKPITTSSADILMRRTRLHNTLVVNNEEIENRKQDIKRFGVSGMVVIDLVADVPQGTKVFVNNYFGSVALIKKMTELGFGIVCTLRQNRIKHCPLPSEKQMNKMERGSYDYRVTNDRQCIVVSWKDSKRVLIGSNYIGIDPIEQLLRWDKNQKKKINTPTPQIIKQYNKHMGGVDKTDMLCSLHPIPFRSKKWYMRLVWRIFDLMLLNSWLLSKHILGRDGNWRMERIFQFKLTIARILLQKPLSLTRPILQSKQVSDSSDSSSNENQNDALSRRKKIKHESKKSALNVQRYDGIGHWPIFEPFQRNINKKKSTLCYALINEVEYEEHIINCSSERSNNQNLNINKNKYSKQNDGKKLCTICSKYINQSEYINYIQSCSPTSSLNNSYDSHHHHRTTFNYTEKDKKNHSKASSDITKNPKKDCFVCFKSIDLSQYENHVLACVAQTDAQLPNSLTRKNLKCLTCNRSINKEDGLYREIPCHLRHYHCTVCLQRSMDEFVRNGETSVCHKRLCDHQLSKYDISLIPLEHRLSDRLLKLVKSEQRPFCSKGRFYVDLNENFNEHIELCDDLIPWEYC
ncbi:unnamed protein product [Rotaria sp. Silwood2]|nr:unnamed protein product [Rotaria sp. Silwood2]